MILSDAQLKKERRREILCWLLQGAKDREMDMSRAKSAVGAAMPYLRGAFAKQFGRKAPTKAEVEQIQHMKVIDFYRLWTSKNTWPG